jgi:hypothetical protein
MVLLVGLAEAVLVQGEEVVLEWILEEVEASYEYEPEHLAQ